MRIEFIDIEICAIQELFIIIIIIIIITQPSSSRWCPRSRKPLRPGCETCCSRDPRGYPLGNSRRTATCTGKWRTFDNGTPQSWSSTPGRTSPTSHILELNQSNKQANRYFHSIRNCTINCKLCIPGNIAVFFQFQPQKKHF